MLEVSQVTTSDPGQFLGESVGDHDVLSGFIDVSDDTLDGIVDFLGLLDSSLLWVEWSNLENRVSPAATTGEVGFEFTSHVALAVVDFTVFTEVVAHPALTTILVTNVLEALCLGFSEACSSRLCSVVSEDLWKISLSSISVAANIFCIVTGLVESEGGVEVVDSLDNLLGGLPDILSFVFVGFGPGLEFT